MNGKSHTHQYLTALKFSKVFLQLQKKHSLDQIECGRLAQVSFFVFSREFRFKGTTQALDISLPISLHQAAFLPVIETQTSPEQQQKWLRLAQNMEIIGCYAQTELSHGSNMRLVSSLIYYNKRLNLFDQGTSNNGDILS